MPDATPSVQDSYLRAAGYPEEPEGEGTSGHPGEPEGEGTSGHPEEPEGEGTSGHAAQPEALVNPSPTSSPIPVIYSLP